jgi:hypothetical protein
LDVTNHAGRTALRRALDAGAPSTMMLLFKAGARADVGSEQTTLLHTLAAEDRATDIPMLLEAGLAVDVRDGKGRTPFQRAVTALSLYAMETLLTNGANINAVDLHGDTALHQLSLQPRDQVQRTIGMVAQQVDQREGLWPLTTINISITGWLLEHGANPNLTNHDGQTPLDLLRAHKWTNSDDEKSTAARIALLLKASAIVRGENELESGQVPDPICVKLQALFQKYYPKATFTNGEATGIHFEYEVGMVEVPADTKSGNPATPSGAQQRMARGPKKGGIMCDVLLQKGEFLGQLKLTWEDGGGPYGKFVIDRKVYKEHLMAPYSAKRDAHLWVNLLCPPDASEDFLKEFDAIMTDFQKDVD